MANIFLALPHLGTVVTEAICAICYPSQKHSVHLHKGDGNALFTLDLNNMWCNALNTVEQEKYTHFAMIHSDVATVPGWLDMLVEEMDKYKLDMLAGIVPIKNNMGLTSSAVVNGVTGEMKRLTMTEVMHLPETFTADVCQPDCFLGFTTGLWLCRFDQPWREDVIFDWRNAIEHDANGKWKATFLCEGWLLSAWAASQNLRIGLTRKVPVDHYGAAKFTNQRAWGNIGTEGAALLLKNSSYQKM